MTGYARWWQVAKNYYHGLVALAAVVFYGYPAKSMVVIGVTGTDGKTTTAAMIYRLLIQAGYRAALISTVGAFLGGPPIDTGFHVTSPVPFPLQKLLRRMVGQGMTHLVLEVTSHGLDQHRVLGTRIHYAVVTNVTREHLDYHGTFKHYLMTKAKIFRQAKVACLNQDDPAYPSLKTLVPVSTQVYPYTRTRVLPWQKPVLRHFPAVYNQENALAAMTLGGPLRLKPEDMAQALLSFPGVPGRGEMIRNSRGLNLVVDFAHTPHGLESVLTALRAGTTGRLIAVFGAAGNRDAGKRPLMGRLASQLADEVVFTSEDSRNENPRLIIRMLLDGAVTNRGHLHAIVDRTRAIRFAINRLARPGDTVAILGKGHERTLNLDGRHELPWSDAAVTQKILKESHGSPV